MDKKLLPYTWGDVADAISGSVRSIPWPLGLVKAEIYWDQITFYIENFDDKQSTIDCLDQIFPFRLKDSAIILDGPSFSQALPVRFEIYDQDLAGVPPLAIPSQYVAASTQIWFRRTPISETHSATLTPIFAFHSVKGGVGRTTSALSFALSLVDKFNQRPLLIDADFEAPGISYLFHGDGREAFFSLEDLLVLAHADADTQVKETVRFAGEKLINQKQSGITIMPCLRNSEMLSAFTIRPEQLQRSHSEQPFFLAETLRKVAIAANCTSIVIDLRAGFTDLAAMMLCAPNVAPVFVTTPSGQAISSTQQMLSFIGSQVTSSRQENQYPAIVINNVISQVRRSAEFAGTIRDLEGSASSFIRELSEDSNGSEIIDLDASEVYGVPVVILDHAPALTAAPSSLRYFIDDLRSQSCFDQLSEGLHEWTSQYLDVITENHDHSYPNEIVSAPAKRSSTLEDRRKQLHDFARKRVFAETADAATDEFLIVDALRELAVRFRTELPNATCIGMKGAGKTFTFRVLCQHGTWSSYLSKVGGEGRLMGAGASILPVLPARSLQRLPFASEMRASVASSIGAGEPIPLSLLNSLIEQATQEITTESAWGEFWLDTIGWSCGIESGQIGAGKKLVQLLVDKGIRIVSVFDGLEEAFQSFRSDARQQAAIRGLTSALSQMLLELPGRPLGQINFVRSDLVASAFPNNARQFADRNRSFALTWYEQDILELAGWLAVRSGAVSLPSTKRGVNGNSDLAEKLIPLWGHKLGKADDLAKGGRTREPRSAEWVVAALSDLRGRLTARDLVGFIANSAERSITDQSTSYNDRLLIPRAMTSAIKPVGAEKINAMAEENPGLKPIIEALRRAPQFSVPIALEDFGNIAPDVDARALTMLNENGIILVEGDSIEMPEIFRTGLGNVVRTKGGRRSIIGLMNKARQNRLLDTVI
ncbi:ParA family protein [Methylorubrum podarium]|uniref:ParA family protein n=1 Tax=Methylorubrum podarium TaxID=200476 RepID=UPI001EE25231|nr:ParA family protein [Methylorubrum podarium]GJE72592.1 hypothetical protein CHKEEEPN_4149 [Methylorubrum podarium]